MFTESVPTWVYGPKGESKLIGLAPGAEAPKGWAFAPPKGVDVKVEDAPTQPIVPASSAPGEGPRIAALEVRVALLETQMSEVGDFLETLTAPKTETIDERPALLARTKELGLEGFDGRSSAEKMKAAIAEAEAKKAEG